VFTILWLGRTTLRNAKIQCTGALQVVKEWTGKIELRADDWLLDSNVDGCDHRGPSGYVQSRRVDQKNGLPRCLNAD
jgi:hypothetical protein